MRRLFLVLAISFAVTSWILAIAQSAVASSGWSTPVTIAEGLHPTSVSCPSSSFCAVVDEDGRAAIYDSGSWSAPIDIDGTEALTSVSCASSLFCAAVDKRGHAATYANGSWGTFVSVGGRFHAVSCPSVSFCVAGNDGRVAIYNGTSWTESNFIDTAPAGEHSFYAYTLTSVSCPSTSFCATVDGWGKALTYDGTSWSAPVSIDGETWLTSVSCTSSSFCAAVDQRGNALTYNGSSWSAPNDIDGTGDVIPDGFTSVSCPASSFCAAVDQRGNALTYNGSSWSAPASIDSGHELTSVSCPSAAFCAAIDYVGHILTYHATPPSNTSTPSISGAPVQGDILTALHGIWTDNPTSYSYQWQLCNSSGGNCGAIPGATASSYTLAEQDVGQTIRVQESAANIVGTSEPVVSSATGVVGKPPRGIGQAEVGRATTRGPTAAVPVRCTGPSGAGCQIALTMRLGVKLKNGNRALRRAAKLKTGTLRRTVIVAKKTAQLNAGHRRLVRIRLNGAGRHLLKARHRLSVRFRATQTANGAMAAVSIQKLTFRTRTHSNRKRGRAGNG
jgi:hypothetical protein